MDSAASSGQTVTLSETMAVPLLGVPLVYASNSGTVIATLRRALEPWASLPPDLVEPQVPGRVTVLVYPPQPDDPAPPPAGGFVTRTYENTFAAAWGPNLLNAHLAAGEALAWITPTLAADEPALRDNVLVRLGLLLASTRDRSPVQAAGVVHAGHAILLVNTGSSDLATLCYSCVRTGFALLATDTIWVSTARRLRIWGNPGTLRLPLDAARHFPELSAATPQAGSDDRSERVINVAERWPERLATHAEAPTVCFVEQAAGQASRLEPIATAEARAVGAPHTPTFPAMKSQISPILAALTDRGAYRLRVGADPTSAVTLLAHLAEQR